MKNYKYVKSFYVTAQTQPNPKYQKTICPRMTFQILALPHQTIRRQQVVIAKVAKISEQNKMP